MKRTHLRRLLSVLILLAWAGLPAAESAKAPAPAKSQVANAEVIVLPKIQVTSSRIKELDTTIAKLYKLIVREKKKVKSTSLDKSLNNQKLSTAAALFGGNSAEHLSAVAATRVSLMETERAVLEDMKRPANVADLAALETELEQLRLTRRNLDSPAAQR